MSSFMKQHEPKTFSDLLFADDNVEKRLNQYANGERTRNLILHGGYGTGKSTIARLICEARVRPAMMGWLARNGANVTGDEIRILGNSLRLLKLEEDAIPTCVIDEANILSTALQYKLRALMDDCDAMIIMTTNYPHAIDASLRNRCDVVKIDPLPPERMLPAAKKILSANGIKISDEDTLQLLGATDGTWRRALEVLEDATLALTP